MPKQNSDSSDAEELKITPEAEQALNKAMNDIWSSVDTKNIMAKLVKNSSVNIMQTTLKNWAMPPLVPNALQHMTQSFGADVMKSIKPAATIDYNRLFGSTIKLANFQIENMLPPSTFKPFLDVLSQQRKQYERIFEGFAKIADLFRPPNWKGVPTPSADQLETLILDEGLTLAWVPHARILKSLFAASTMQDRRKILGSNWKSIAKSCRQNLESIDDEGIAEYVEFALTCIDQLEAGFAYGAQALATNLLDTMLKDEIDGDDRKTATNQKQRPDIDNLPLRASLVFGGIWGSHATFHEPSDGIPRRYTRHASVHGVSKRQYSRINAILAIMHVTSFLMLLDSGDLG